MNPILIQHAHIVNEGKEFTGSVLIEGDKISRIFTTEVSQEVVKNCQLIDARGLTLLPGIIDDQVHFREPGLTHKADIATESAAAVAGGVTTFMEMPNTNPQTVTLELLEAKYRLASEKSHANFSFYMGATNDNYPELVRLDPGQVCGIKVFMGASTGNMLVDDPQSLDKIFSIKNILIATHCEDETIIRHNLSIYRERFGDDIPVKYHPSIRTEEACYKSSSLAINLAKKHGTRLHLLHLSTARELSLLDNNHPPEKKQITAEVCVHHLWFSQDDYERLGSFIKWNPAIKTAYDRSALLEALKDGRIDVVATDHAPHTREEKGKNYILCPSGGPLVQHSLQAMLEFVNLGKLSLPMLTEKMCHVPAKIFRIKNRGFIREGYYADLVLVDRNKSYRVAQDNLLYKCMWSPFEGIEFHSTITHTFVNGQLAFSRGKVHPETRGKRLQFHPFPIVSSVM